MDLRLSQEIPVPVLPTGKLKLYMDIENFGNLLNEKWGVLEQYPFYRGVGTVVLNCQTAGVASSCAAPNAVYQYSSLQSAGAAGTPLGGEAKRPNAQLPASTWQIKFGARISF